MIGLIWAASLIGTLIVADQKRLNIWGYLILAIFTGPLALVIALLVSAKSPSVISPGFSSDARIELTRIRSELSYIQQRVSRLEMALEGEEKSVAAVPPQSAVPELRTSPAARPVLQVVQPVAGRDTEAVPAKALDLEIVFGRDWLNKIGMAVFTLGVAFLISYAFKYFPAILKIGLGYAISAVLFAVGARLEPKKKFSGFARVLLGGGWALVYFTTYAMYHFPASRIIPSQGLDIFLLAAVVVAMVSHVLRYKSEGMMSVALFVAYLTATLGEITFFTVGSCLLLALLLLFLVYQFQWFKAFLVGVILTYTIHVFWVMPHIMESGVQALQLGVTAGDYNALMNFVFLTSYWAVFTAGMHILKLSREEKTEQSLAAANFGNTLLYAILACPQLLRLPEDQRFLIVMVLGFVQLTLAFLMRLDGRRKLYMGDVISGVFFISVALPLRFVQHTTLLLWFLEIPALLLAGALFSEKVYRYLSYALTLVAVLWFSLSGLAGDLAGQVVIGGAAIAWKDFLLLWAAAAMAAAFYLAQKVLPEKERTDADQVFNQGFSILAVGFLTWWVFSVVDRPWLSLVLALEALVLFGAGVFPQMNRFRVYGYLVLMAVAGIVMSEKVMAAGDWQRWVIVGGDIFVFYFLYYVLRTLFLNDKVQRFIENEEVWALGGGIVVTVAALFQYLEAGWVSLGLGIAGLFLTGAGILLEDKPQRMGGLVLFALCLGRILLVDLTQFSTIFKIITFIALGLIFLGVSFGYNRYAGGQEKKDKDAKT